MSGSEPSDVRNLDIYGSDALSWRAARDAIAGSFGPNAPNPYSAATLGTVRPDGRPHAAFVGAIWVDDTLYFVSGPGTRKSRNLEANPNCTLALQMNGIDVVLEGVASRVTDPATLERLAASYRTNGWPVEVDGETFTAPYSAPSAGPPPWYLYRLSVRSAFGVGGDQGGATRWQFEATT